MRLFHIVDRSVWDAAKRSGEYRPESLGADGFVHFSFASQVRGTADRYYADVPNLFVVEIDPARLQAEIRIENGFPHVYGAIPASAAVATYDLDDALFRAGGPAAMDR